MKPQPQPQPNPLAQLLEHEYDERTKLQRWLPYE